MSATEATKKADAGAGTDDDRGSRRKIIGTITSTVMDKTITVTVIRRVRDRRFHKFLTNRVKYHVHDEHNSGKVGDVVEIIEARPMSKTKRWRLLRTLSRAVVGSEGAAS
jgi:small subunit ribosomal protein S17